MTGGDARIEDVVIVGAGPAGLSAALVLVRARRRVVVLDGGAGRSAVAPASHGFLGHDGVPPGQLWEQARAQLARYPEFSLVSARAMSLERAPEAVRVTLAEGAPRVARRVLLATGVRDVLPKLEGLPQRWGRSAFSCAHCHGYERASRPWAVLASDAAMLRSAPLLRAWSDQLSVHPGPGLVLDEAARADLRAHEIALDERAIMGLEGEEGELEALRLEDGSLVPCGALLLRPKQRQSDLVLFSGLAIEDNGALRVDDTHETSMERVHACGDAARGGPQVAFAVGDGAYAGKALLERLMVG